MRDMTDKQFVAAMKRNGWTTYNREFMGYWNHAGMGMSEFNYGTRREALAAFIKAGEKRDVELAEAKARKEA